MQAKFTQGSIFKHICNMTFASTAGLLSLFFVDLMDMYWLSLLGEIELAAAIGYSGSILFFTLSLSIGLAIGTGAVVSQSIGLGRKHDTQKLIGNVFLTILLVTTPFMLLVYGFLEHILGWLGAEAKAFDFAVSYMRIVLPSMPLLAIAMACSGVIRAMGNAKEAMYLTLLGGIVNAVFDPIFIFGFGWGIEGAAVATVVSRVAMLVFGMWLIAVRSELFALPDPACLWRDFKNYCEVAVPAMLTNLSTPIGVAYVTAIMAQFGDGAVAGSAIVSKIQPLAFAGLFALSGSVGPIVGQNLGARQFDRIMETLLQSLKFVVGYCVIACTILFLLAEPLVAVFQAEGDAALLIRWFCWGLSAMFVFNGLTFCTNAFFNNLKSAQLATVVNFSKATLFTMPFVYYGAQWGGPVGVFVGLFLGSVLIGLIGLWLAYIKVKDLPRRFAEP